MTLAQRKRKCAKFTKFLRSTLALTPEVSACVWVKSDYMWAVICIKRPMVDPTTGEIADVTSFMPLELEPGHLDTLSPKASARMLGFEEYL